MLRKFIYKVHSMEECKYPFRIGDVVRVSSFSECYSWFTLASRYFFHDDTKTGFYNDNVRLRSFDTKFKIKKMVAHSYFGYHVICYCVDREGKDIIIDANGLKLVKQYPLRRGESTEIELEVLR